LCLTGLVSDRLRSFRSLLRVRPGQIVQASVRFGP
jgi:hypothetical protein